MDIINTTLGVSNIIIGILMIILVIPLKKRTIKMTRFYGFRFKKSFESEECWYKINEYGAKRFMIWSIILIIIGMVSFILHFQGDRLLISIFAIAPMIVLIPTLETYYFAKNL